MNAATDGPTRAVQAVQFALGCLFFALALWLSR